jgi:hypothetical protein
MSLKKYIPESERAVAFPITGDVLEVVVREDFDDEIAIDFPVVEHTDDSITLHLDEYAYGILEDCNYVGDDTDGTIDPPSEELDEGIVKVTNIKWDAEDDVSDLSTTMTVPVPVGLDDEDTEEFISDYLTNKTGITHDGFRIAEALDETTQEVEEAQPETQVEQVQEIEEVDEVAESIAKLKAMAGVGSKARSNHGIHEGEEGYQLTPRSIVARQMRKLQDIERS